MRIRAAFWRHQSSCLFSRPAISKSISKLERELGASLFCRHASGVTLTADGERLLPKIRAAVEAFEAVEQEAAHTGNQRPIRLGCTYGVSQLLENALRDFSARSENPAVQSGFVTFEDIPRLLKNRRNGSLLLWRSV